MKTILLIEDDKLLAELYSDVLSAASYRVLHAATARQGLDLLDENSIDVIVLDILLSEHNGIALLHQFHSYPDLADIPVIVQSALDPSRSGVPPETWRAYGVSEYLWKVEARPQELLRTIERILAA